MWRETVKLSTRLSSLLIISTALLTTACTSTAGPASLTEAHAAADQALKSISGKGKFQFDLPFGNTDESIPIYYHIPKGAGADTQVLFVMHGTNRDADRYRDEWSDYAERFGIIVVAPQFSKAQFPRANGYNLGNVFTSEDGDWQGLVRSPFAVIEPLFDTFRAKFGVGRDKYYMYGHSAGSQFVHRFIFMVPDARLEKAISANAGWYTMPDLTVQWPYGLRGTGLADSDLKKLLAAPLVVLLGEEDNDPTHSSLRTSPEANAQGAYRLERGQVFFEYGEKVAVPGEFGWQIGRVPGAGHKNSQMAPAAVKIIIHGDKL